MNNVFTEVHNFQLPIHHQYRRHMDRSASWSVHNRVKNEWNDATTWSRRILWHHIRSSSHHHPFLKRISTCLKFNFWNTFKYTNANPPCLFFKSIHYTHLQISYTDLFQSLVGIVKDFSYYYDMMLHRILKEWTLNTYKHHL